MIDDPNDTLTTIEAKVLCLRYGIENMANLSALPAAGATIFVGAPKHVGGTGGPARILAVT